MTQTKARTKAQTTARQIAGECLAGRARLISRAISSIYEDALRPHGVTVAQMGILAVASALENAHAGEVARKLCLEKSTLSRNLDRMVEHGWIDLAPGADDARFQQLRVTSKGARLIERAAADWKTAQREARDMLGEQGAAALTRLGDRLMAAGRGT